MIQSTRGIVLKYYPYSESSIIVKIFTENFGLQSYIVKGISSKKSKTKLAFFQPLTLLEFLAYHKDNKSIHHLKEPVVSFHYQSIPSDTTKRSILFFLSELLYKTIREEVQDKPLFDWLYNTLTWFDLTDKNTLNFHLVFTLQLSRFLGFSPKSEQLTDVQYFDLQEGRFVSNPPEHPHYASDAIAKHIYKLSNTTFENSDIVVMSTTERRMIIDLLMTYYQLHEPGFGEMKSLEVLKAIT